MNRMLLTIPLLVLAACSSSPSKPDGSQTELVTRQSEPMVQRPKRVAAVRFEVSDEIETGLEEMLLAESDSNEILFVTGLTWADGRRTVAVVHVHYPPEDMSEGQHAAVVDDAVLQRCDTDFVSCVDGLESCPEEAYESCIRTAYRDSFVYMSSHLGIDCGVLELSMYALEGNRPTLSDRRPLDPMVCEVDYYGEGPAALDIDGDGGAELVYTWASTRESLSDGAALVESLAIIDANDLHDQFRTSVHNRDGYDGESIQFHGLSTIDTNGDGFLDLQVKSASLNGYCDEFGWALDPRFMVPEEGDEEDDCSVEVSETDYIYDAAGDLWHRADGAEE